MTMSRMFSAALSVILFLGVPCFPAERTNELHAAEPEEKADQPPPLTEGSVVNKSDVEMLIVLVKSNRLSGTFHLMPGQSLTVPKDIVEANVERAYVSPIPVKYSVLVVMPDGKKHEVKTYKDTVRLSAEES
ncbi:MAG TPA: hypothetical protein PKL97_03490 [Candidatus Omnitrophota bacterium]|nr:hypothetical protein [Candidatus Omnitrophota bacterium]